MHRQSPPEIDCGNSHYLLKSVARSLQFKIVFPLEFASFDNQPVGNIGG